MSPKIKRIIIVFIVTKSTVKINSEKCGQQTKWIIEAMENWKATAVAAVAAIAAINVIRTAIDVTRHHTWNNTETTTTKNEHKAHQVARKCVWLTQHEAKKVEVD